MRQTDIPDAIVRARIAPPRFSTGSRALLPIIILIAAISIYAADPFNYFIGLKNFTKNIYGENTSHYRLVSSNEGFSLVETGYQHILKTYSENGKTIIEVRCGTLSSALKKEKEISEFLPDTRFLNLNSPEISGAASKLDRSDPVNSVEHFVFDHIADKFTGMPLIPAEQVYRMKRGDCTEHTVLTVALLRRMNVPSRAVVGMYLADEFNGRRDVFVYHMWAEAYRTGRWELVDATRPGKKQSNRYIAFAYHNLKTEAPLPYLRAVSSIQDLTLEYRGR